MAYIPKFNPDGTIYDPNKVDNTTNAERMAFADWSTTAVRDIELRLQQAGANLTEGQYIQPTAEEFKILKALQPNAYTDDYVYGNYGGASATPSAGSKSAFTAKFGDVNTPGSTAYNEAQVAAGNLIKVPVGNSFSYIPAGSAAAANQPNIGTQNTAEMANSGQGLPTDITNNQPQAPQAPQPATNAVQEGQPQIDPTTGQPVLDATLGTNPTQVGGKFGTQQFGKIGNDVYEIMSDGSRRKVTAAEFNQKLKAQGLNLDVLPQLDQNQGFSDGMSSGPAGSGPDGIMGTADDPSSFLSDYKNIIKELGLTDIKTQFENIQKEYKKLQDEKINKQIEINNNPWLSEGLRVTELRKLDAKYEAKEANLTNQMELYDSLYQEGLAQAKYLTSGLQEERNKLLDLAMKREEAEQKLELEFLKAAEKKYGPGIIGEYQYALDQGYKGSFIQYQNEDANRKARSSSSGLGALTQAQMNSTINQIAGSFDNEPITKEYNTIAAQLQALKSAGTSPTDDIQRIYAFAKVMDPNSVVREGEYNTVQQYSQALLTQYGLKAKRVFDNSGFLTPEARTFLQNTLQNRFNQTETQYNNLRNSYQQRIQNVQSGGFNTLTDYGGAFKVTPDSELAEDIASIGQSLGTREKLIEALVSDYPEFTRDYIANRVYTLIPDR